MSSLLPRFQIKTLTCSNIKIKYFSKDDFFPNSHASHFWISDATWGFDSGPTLTPMQCSQQPLRVTLSTRRVSERDRSWVYYDKFLCETVVNYNTSKTRHTELKGPNSISFPMRCLTGALQSGVGVLLLQKLFRLQHLAIYYSSFQFLSGTLGKCLSGCLQMKMALVSK